MRLLEGKWALVTGSSRGIGQLYPVETVLPGALVPALLDDHGPTGRFFSAQDYRVLGENYD